MITKNIIVERSKAFALRIIKLRYFLIKEKKEYIMSEQVFRCGTSVGANVKEAIRGQSKPDFCAKMNIALKEASEAEYWLELLHESNFIADNAFESLYSDCQEILKILVSITKTQKKKKSNTENKEDKS